MNTPADPASKKRGPKSSQRVIKLTPTDRAPLDRLLADLPLEEVGPITMIKTPHGDVIVHLVPFGTHVILQTLVAVDKKRGAGTAAMKIICAAADRQHVTLSVIPEPLKAWGQREIPKRKLVAFYAAFGFEDDGRTHMTRAPR
jgi:hypothetical protein